MESPKTLWFVGVGTEEDGTTFIHVKPYPVELWEKPKRFDYVPKKVLETYLGLNSDDDPEYKIRLIHIFSERDSLRFDAIMANAVAYGGPNADFEAQQLLENLVGCGVLAIDPDRFHPVTLGLSPLLE